jgi:glycosyltransferase
MHHSNLDKRPLISLITVTYNSEKFLGQAMESVLAQDFQDFEHIIIDGASKDGTLAVIDRYRDQFTSRLVVVSEPDRGIYDAMNKGLKLARGEIVGFLNSDDFFAESSVFSQIAEVYSRDNPDIIYADLLYVDKANPRHVIRRWTAGPIPSRKMRFGWHPPHPTLYIKNELIQSIGGFDLRYRLGADYALMLKLIESQNISYSYIPKVFVRMRIGGESNRSWKNIYDSNLECLQSWSDIGRKPSLLFVPLKLLRKVLQFVHARI